MSDKKVQHDYLTPPEECEAIYRILDGEPALDPCGHPDQFLKAARVLYGDPHEGDGLAARWSDHGTTAFLNPTHGDREPQEPPNFTWHPFTQWVMKASLEAQRGVTVLAFLPAATDRRWFHQYMPETQIVCLLEKRVKSFAPAEKYGDPPIRCKQPNSAHLYALWTKEKAAVERFYEALKDRGFIAEPSPID